MSNLAPRAPSGQLPLAVGGSIPGLARGRHRPGVALGPDAVFRARKASIEAQPAMPGAALRLAILPRDEALSSSAWSAAQAQSVGEQDQNGAGQRHEHARKFEPSHHVFRNEVGESHTCHQCAAQTQHDVE